MATHNTQFQFNNYLPNVFYNKGPMITTPYEQYPQYEPTDLVSNYGISCDTYCEALDKPVVALPCMQNNLGNERYGNPVQEQPLDMCTDLVPSFPWLLGCKLTLQLNSVSNVSRVIGLTIPSKIEFLFLTRDLGILVLENVTLPSAYKWNRSVSTNIAFLTIVDFTEFELRASTPHYGTCYSNLGFANYSLEYERCTAKQLLPQSKYTIRRDK